MISGNLPAWPHRQAEQLDSKSDPWQAALNKDVKLQRKVHTTVEERKSMQNRRCNSDFYETKN